MEGKARLKLVTDATCDLPKELQELYKIEYLYNEVKIGNHTMIDGKGMNDVDIYKYVKETQYYPQLLSVSPETYKDFFANHLNQANSVIYITSSVINPVSFDNAKEAAEELQNVYIVDSKNISGGMGHLVVKAAVMSKVGFPVDKIVRELGTVSEKIYASFISSEEYEQNLNTDSVKLSTIALATKFCWGFALEDGEPKTVKQYPGSWEDVAVAFADDFMRRREEYSPKQLLITQIGCNQDIIHKILEEINAFAYFDKVYVSQASVSVGYITGMESFGIYALKK